MHKITKLMDEVYMSVKNERVEDAVEAILRKVALADVPLALKALTRLLVIEHARLRHASAELIESARQ
jgi:hypothetical protein